MASGSDVSHTPGRSGSNGPHSRGSSMADKASTHAEELLPLVLNDGSPRATSTCGEALVLNPKKKQKTFNAKYTTTHSVFAASTPPTRAPATTTTTVTNTKTPTITTRDLTTTTTTTKAATSTPQTTTALQHNGTAVSPKQGRMTAASFFEVEDDETETRGTKRKREALESSAPPLTVSLQSTNTVVASHIPNPKILPEKIVLLIDRQDAYLKSFYYPKVSHIYDNKLNFENAFSMIKKTGNVYKNTLFVMLCGTMSALKREINKECHLFLCKEPLYNYCLQDSRAPNPQEHLINEAKALRKKITAMENCDIIFSGMLPVKIDRAEAYEAERHYSQTGHQVRVNSSRCEGLYNGLCAGLREFNKWAKEDATLLGFPNWSLVDVYTADDSSAPENSDQHYTNLREDGSSSSNGSSKSPPAECSNQQHAEDVMKDTRSIPSTESHRPSQDSITHTTGDNENPTENSISPNSPPESCTSHQTFTHPTEANGVTLTKECTMKRCLAIKKRVAKIFARVMKLRGTQKPPVADAKKNDKVKPKAKSQGPVSPPGGDVHVVVVGDAKHNNVLLDIIDPFLYYKKVTLITHQKLNPSAMENIVKKYNSQVPRSVNTVWMLCFGLLDFIDLKDYPKCLNNNKCISSLQSLSVKKSEWVGNIECKVKEVMNTVSTFKSQLESGILSSALLLVVPPVPIAVLDGQTFMDHQELHSVAETYKLFICDKKTYDLIKMVYSRLYEVWPVVFGKLEEGISLNLMTEYLNRSKKMCSKLFGGGAAHACTSGNEWKKMMKQVVKLVLEKYPLVLSGVKISSQLSIMPFISLLESSSQVGKMLSLHSQKMTNKEDRVFRQVVIIGDQLPAELDELCCQFSIHVVPERVTLNRSGRTVIQEYQKLWPKDTLWVILVDIFHMVPSTKLDLCVSRKCKEILQVYHLWDIPGAISNKEMKACFAQKIESFITNVKTFTELLSEDLGDGSAVFLPPITPVFLLHEPHNWRHEDLHRWYKLCKKAIPVINKRKRWRVLFHDMKCAWLKMLEPHLAKYPILMKTLDLYKEGKEDWITALGNFLAYFASAEKDIDDAVFSDAEFSSGEEAEIEEENTEDLAGLASSQYPSTIQFNNPSVAHTSWATPAPAPSLHPVPPTFDSAFPPHPRIAVRQDLLDKRDFTPTNPGSTLEGTHWTIASETPVDFLVTIENTQHESPQRRVLLETPRRVLHETPINIPWTSGNTSGLSPKRTLRKTPVNTSNIPGNSSPKVHQKTALRAPAEASVQQHWDGKEIMMMRMAQWPQQTGPEKDHLTSNTEKGRLSPRAEGGLLISRANESHLSPKTKKHKFNSGGQRTSKTKMTGVIPKASGILMAEITSKAEKGQVSFRKKDKQANGSEENKVTVKIKRLESQRKEKDQILRAEKDKIVIQGEDVTLPKEDKAMIERDQHLQRFTLTKGVDAEMNDENGQWIILSETEEDDADASDENLGDPEDECPKNLLKEEQDAVSVEKETVNDHKKDAITNVMIAAERQSVVPNAKPTRDTTASGTPDTSHSVVSEAKNLQSKDSKDNKTSAVVQYTKDNNAASSALDKHSKEANTDSTNRQNKDSNTHPTVSEHSNTEPSAESKYKKINTTPAKAQHTKSSHTPVSAWDKTSNTPQPTIGTPMKKGNTASPIVDKKKSSNTASPLLEKSSTTASPLLEKSSTTASPLLEKSSTTASPLLEKSSTIPSPIVTEKTSNTAPSAMDNKNSNIIPSVADENKKGGDGSSPALVSHSRSSSTAPPTAGKNNKNVTPPTQDENAAIALTLDELSKKSNTTPKALNKHRNTASPALNKPSNRAPSALDGPIEDSSPPMAQFPCLAKPQSTHNKTDNYEASAEQGIPPDPQETEEDLSYVEVLSNTNSVEIIILTSSDEEQESLGYYPEDCQSMRVQAIPQIGSQPCGESLNSPNECSFVESELLQEDFCGAVVTETKSVMGGSPGGGDRGSSQPLGRKRKLSFSNRSSDSLSSSSTSSSSDLNSMEGCLRGLWEQLRGTSRLLWHTYLLTPEAHPDFEEKLTAFNTQYKESNGGAAQQDPEHREKAWRVFWRDWVKKELQEEKQKSELLYEKFRTVIENSQRASGENQPKQAKVNKENHTLEGDCANTNAGVIQEEDYCIVLESPPGVNQKSSCVSSNILSQLPSSTDQARCTSLSVSPIKSKQLAPSVDLRKSKSRKRKKKRKTSSSLNSCLAQMSRCHQMISNISSAALENETAPHNPSLNTKATESCKRRVHLILRCFKMVSEFGVTLGAQSLAVVPIIKAVLDVGVQSDKVLDILSEPNNVNVMKMCSDKFRQTGEQAKGAYREKLLQCNSDIDELIENISARVLSQEMIEGLHIPTIAKMTAQKDTSSVLEFVREALAMRNVHNPPKSLVNKLFMAVSTQHSIMATQSSPEIEQTTLGTS